MRRRSEGKKSTDAASPAPAAATARRSNRRSQKTPTRSEADKNLDENESQPEKELNNRASSEECHEVMRRSRTSRNRTPVKENATPAKRKNKREFSSEAKIDVIPEEENGSEEKVVDTIEEEEEVKLSNEETVTNSNSIKVDKEAEEENVASSLADTKYEDTVKNAATADNQADGSTEKEKQPDIKANSCETAERLSLGSEEQEQQSDVISMVAEPNEEAELEDSEHKEDVQTIANNTTSEDSNTHKTAADQDAQVQSQKHDGYSVDNGRTRKRRWLSKKCSESKAPILAISTDSLKNLIADVHPVPLSDIQLDSSSEMEEVVSEREEGEETPSPERERDRERDHDREREREHERRPASMERMEKILKRSVSKTKVTIAPESNAISAPTHVQHSPSPASNQSSCVLYITNLVRPFTILQLKGLLARTGKIVENGFWIDRIKSKCFVQYETDDEAIETRHALHGVRWPVSNPKCLNVEFGEKAEMERAIESTKNEGPRFGQDNSKDNLIVGSGWHRDRVDIDGKKVIRPVREWDVGKKESLDREKVREVEKQRSRERDTSENRENQRNEKDKKNRNRGREIRSSSLSPVRKIKKKENDPPLRLLDDLFRKTKASPCIYWLPLTPEQIAEKEAFRLKRIEEHKERIKQKEIERGKEREKDRSRANERDREQRRNRSSDRRRSRSRDRRRY